MCIYEKKIKNYNDCYNSHFSNNNNNNKVNMTNYSNRLFI